ncbi:9424_t:CDS:1, partial [Dentiscutata heterogama]
NKISHLKGSSRKALETPAPSTVLEPRALSTALKLSAPSTLKVIQPRKTKE